MYAYMLRNKDVNFSRSKVPSSLHKATLRFYIIMKLHDNKHCFLEMSFAIRAENGKLILHPLRVFLVLVIGILIRHG
jgi:hypothetical protein